MRKFFVKPNNSKALLLVAGFVVLSLWTEGDSRLMSSQKGLLRDQFINNLKNSGGLAQGENNSSDPLLSSSCSAMDCDPQKTPFTNTDKVLLCETMLATPACQALPEEDKKTCDAGGGYHYDALFLSDELDFLAGCTSGLFDSAKALLQFMGSVLKWVWQSSTSPVKTGQSAGQYMESVQLYLTEEYDKGYQEAVGPFKSIKAGGAVASKVAGLLVQKLMDFLYKEYQEFGCMNYKARISTLCFVAGEILLPPAAAFAFLKAGRLSVQGTEKLNLMLKNKPTLFLSKRKKMGEQALDRSLGLKEAQALQEAHLVGKGKKGKDGGPAGLGNYTQAQIRKKAEILNRAGFSSSEVRTLMEEGVVGVSSRGFRGLFSKKPALPLAGDSRYDSFRNQFNEGKVTGDNRYVSFINDEGVQDVGKVLDSTKKELRVVDPQGNTFRIDSRELLDVRVSQAAKDVFSVKEGFKLDDTVSFPRTGGGRSNGKIVNYAKDGSPVVEFVENSKRILKTLNPSFLQRPFRTGDQVRITNSSGKIEEAKIIFIGDDMRTGSNAASQSVIIQYSRNNKINTKTVELKDIQEVINKPNIPMSPKGEWHIDLSNKEEVTQALRASRALRDGTLDPDDLLAKRYTETQIHVKSPVFRLPNSTDANRSAFRQAFNQVQEGSDTWYGSVYVSFPYGDKRLGAKLKKVGEDFIEVDWVDDMGHIHRHTIKREALEDVKISKTAKTDPLLQDL